MEASFHSLPLYFSLKGKHGYALDNAGPFIDAVRAQVEALEGNYDVVAYPESRFPFLKMIASGLGNAVELQKREKAEVCALALANYKWSKLERRSQERAWAEMGENFTINLVKSNQRHRYVPYLFRKEPVAPDARVLLLDDFIMSGTTLLALEAAIGRPDCEAFGVFYQKPAGG